MPSEASGTPAASARRKDARFIEGLRSLETERDQRVRRWTVEKSTPARRDHHILLAVAPHIGGRDRMRRRVDLFHPQLLAVARVEGAEPAVDGRTDEHQVPGGRDCAAQTRRASLDSAGLELLEDAQR